MSGSRHWIFLMLAAVVAATRSEAQTKAPYLPEPIAEADWVRRVGNQQGQLTNQPCRVCFIGDSLTEFWSHQGRDAWEREFVPLKSLNLGLTADRTEHILNRIQRLEFRRANPKVVVLMMGTNNLGKDPPDTPKDVARAIGDGIAMLQKKMPQASILVLSIPPSGVEPNSALRQRIKQTNALLTEARSTWPGKVQLLPIYEAMVDAQDRWRDGFTRDGTHFTETAYGKLADLIAPEVKKMLEAPPVTLP